MKKNKAAVTLLLTLALTGLLLFTAAVGWGTDGAGAAKDIIRRVPTVLTLRYRASVTQTVF